MIYVGTASKSLAPGLRLGWLSVPGSLREPFALAKDRLDRGTSALEQRTFAEFIAGGTFDRHVRRMRSFYHRRRDDLEQAIAGVRPDLRLSGVFAGMHALIYLPSHGPPSTRCCPGPRSSPSHCTPWALTGATFRLRALRRSSLGMARPLATRISLP